MPGFVRGLAPEHWFLLALLGSATFFLGYDGSIFALVLPFLARDFRVAPAALAGPLALLQLAGLVAIPLNRLADRQGRRRILVPAALGYALANLASAFAGDLATLIATRVVAKILGTVEASLAVVVLSEELPASARGTGMGILSLLGVLGSGLVALLLPLASAPFAWRGLYAASVPALVVVVLLRLRLRETRRFLTAEHRLEPVKVLLHRNYRGRAATLGSFFLITTIPAPAATFLSSYALGDLHLQPSALTRLIALAGAAAVGGYLIGGPAADALGRRAMIVITTAALSPAIVCMYRGDTAGLWVGAVAGALLLAAATPALTAYTSELFPTSARATANAWIGACAVAGTMAGLAFVQLATSRLGGLSAALTWLAVPPLPALGLIALLPETARRELDEVASEPP